MDLMRLMRGGVEDSRLHPLLYVAGGAAAAAGVYGYIKRKGKSTSDSGSTTGDEDPMWATDLNLVQPSECPQAQVMQCERDQNVDTILKAEKAEIQKTLILKEEILKAHTILQAKKDERKKTLIYQEELLKVTLAEAQEKEKKAVESITRLEAEKSELTDEVKELQSTVEKLGSLLDKNQGKCEELTNKCEQELEAHTILLAENAEMMRALIQQEKLLKVTLADAQEKQRMAAESITQLETERSELMDKVKELQSTVEKLGRLLDKNQRKCEDLTNECERELEAHAVLLAENEEMMKTLIQQKKLLKVTRADAEKRQQKDVEAIAVLRAEKSDLIYKVKKLQRTVEDLGNLRYKTQHEREQEQEAYTILQAENVEIKKTLIQNEELLKVTLAEAQEKQQTAVQFITQLETERSELMDKVKKLQSAAERLEVLLDKIQRKCEDLTNECKQEQQAHTILQAENDEIKKTLVHNEELWKVTLAEAQEKQQKAVESITLLETERSELMDKVKELQSTVETLWGLVDKKQRKCEHLMNECEQEREAHTILLGENEEIKKTLIQQEELLKISLANAKAKEKKAEETIANLEAEKSELIAKAKKKQSTMEKVRNALYKTEKKYEDLTSLTLANAQEKQQIAVESITRLETERSELMDKVKELQNTVEKLGNLVDKNQRKCQYLMNECEREPHSILQSENEEIKKTLLQEEQILKVTLVDGEKKQQKDVEAIVVLEAEKSDMIKNGIKLQSTAEDRIVGKNRRLTPSSRKRKMDKKRDAKEKEKKAEEAIANMENETSELFTKVKKKQSKKRELDSEK